MKEDTRTPDQILEWAAETYRQRNAIYRDNYKAASKLMVALFPEGLTLRTEQDWNRMQMFLLDVVKTTRYAAQWQEGGHPDSLRDKAVYAAILEAVDEEGRK